MDDFTILWTNFFLWLGTLLFYYIKRKRFTTGWWIILLYTAISYFSISLFYSKYSKGLFTEHVYILPYVYLWGMIMLSLFPLLNWERKPVKVILLPDIKYMNILCSVVVVLCGLKIVTSFSDLQHGVAMLFSGASDKIIEQYQETTAANLSRRSALASGGSFDVMGVLTNQSVLLAPLVAFLYLLYPTKERKRWLTIGLFLSLLTSPVGGIIRCSRLLIASELLMVFYVFLLAKDYLDRELRRKIFRFGIIVSGFLLFFLVAISMGRAKGNEAKAMHGYQRYFAESFLVFDGYCTNAGGTREGLITAPLLKMVTGERILSSQEARRRYRHLSMDNSRFYTFVGDFVLDWGVNMAFFIFLLFCIFFSMLIKVTGEGYLHFVQFFPIFFVMRFNLGFFQYLYSGIGGGLFIVFLIMLFLFSL